MKYFNIQRIFPSACLKNNLDTEGEVGEKTHTDLSIVNGSH